jgi:hypothetical protein
MLDVSKIAIQIASEFTGSKAFKQAETSTQKLQRQVKNLGRTLGVTLGTAAIVRFGKASVKAFAEDENAARSLGITLKNLGLDYFGASQATNLYISNLEKQTGVLDDELRPAMDRLLRATGSITESQKLLNLALDISAGTGKNLTTVSQSLQKAYLGNNASLGRLGVGLSKAELTSSSFLQIQERLTELFAGQAVSAADSLQGSFNKLTIAANNAKEAIGEGLIGALNILSGGNSSVGGGVEVIDKMAKSIAEGAKNIAFMIKQFEALKPIIIAIGALLLIYFAPVTAAVAALAFILAKGGENLRKSKFNLGPAQQSPGERIAIDKANAAAKKKADRDAVNLTKTGNALKKIDNDLTGRKLALTGDQKALAELEKKFDVERVGLYSALNQTTDSETKMRLLSLIAIHDQNAALAGMIMKANQTEDALAALTEAIRSTIRGMLDAVAAALARLQERVGVTPTPAGFTAFAPAPGGYEGSGSGMSVLGQNNYGGLAGAGIYGGGGAPVQNISVVVNNAGSVYTERDLVNTITQGIYNNQASGIPINYSTAY